MNLLPISAITIIAAISAGSTLSASLNEPIVAPSIRTVNSNERQILEQHCQQIASYYMNALASNAKSSSAYEQAMRSGITQYLQSVGTPTALLMLKELQSTNFRKYSLGGR